MPDTRPSPEEKPGPRSPAPRDDVPDIDLDGLVEAANARRRAQTAAARARQEAAEAAAEEEE